MAAQCASRALAAIELQFLQWDPFGYYAYRSVVRSGIITVVTAMCRTCTDQDDTDLLIAHRLFQENGVYGHHAR